MNVIKAGDINELMSLFEEGLSSEREDDCDCPKCVERRRLESDIRHTKYGIPIRAVESYVVMSLEGSKEDEVCIHESLVDDLKQMNSSAKELCVSD